MTYRLGTGLLKSWGDFWFQRLLFIFVLGVLAPVSCGRSKVNEIGSRLESPLALASHPTLQRYYVLNAALSGEFKTGSLQTYAVPNQSTDAATPLSTIEVPRLGTTLTVEKSGEFLVAGFSGSETELKAYSLDASGLPVSSAKIDSTSLPSGRIGSVQVSLVNGQTGVWSVVALIVNRYLGDRIIIYKYTKAAGFEKLADIPSDFYTPSRENVLGNYVMSWGAPVVFPTQGIIVSFPQGTYGYFGKNPSAFDWLSGKVKLQDPAFDLRTVSAAVVDVNALFAGKGLPQALGFVPVALNASGEKADTSAAADAPRNVDYQFHIGYQSALAIDSAALPCQLSGPFASLAQSTAAVVVLNTDAADVVAISGWDKAAEQLRSRLAAGEKQPILGDVLTPSPVSLTQGISSLTGVKTYVPVLQVVNSGSMCTLAWLRIERERSSLGREQSRIQIASDANPTVQLSRGSDLLGMAAFAVNGQVLMAGSFSENKIQVLRFSGASLDNVGVFQP